jgi:putative oxidoreductase
MRKPIAARRNRREAVTAHVAFSNRHASPEASINVDVDAQTDSLASIVASPNSITAAPKNDDEKTIREKNDKQKHGGTEMSGFERQSSLAALALRLIIAGFFGYHFFFKLQAGFAANVTSFELRAFPLPTLFAFVDMFVEACVIPFLVLGIYSRFCMILLIPLMVGIFGVFWPRAFNFSLGGSELPIMWFLVMWVLIIIGDGRYAIRVPHLAFDGRHPSTRLIIKPKGI